MTPKQNILEWILRPPRRAPTWGAVVGYQSLWLSPSGKLFPVENHISGGKEILAKQGVAADDQEVYERLYALGWGRVTNESDRIQFSYSPANPMNSAQLRELKDLGIEKNKPVMNDVTGRVLWSPNWGDSQNSTAYRNALLESPVETSI